MVAQPLCADNEGTGLKVVVAVPSYWPYVRRGAERLIHDITGFLARRGHQVHIITSTPGRPRVAYDGDVRVTYVRQLSNPLMYRYSPMLRLHAFGLAATPVVLREKPDVLRLHSYSGLSWAAWLGAPYLVQVIVLRHWWSNRFDRVVFPNLIRRANRVVALTRKGADAVEAEFRVPCGVLPPPVDLQTFRPCADRDLSSPRILYTGDLADPRKGGWLLLRAWNRIHQELPTARLVLAGPQGLGGYAQRADHSILARLGMVLPEARAAIDVVGAGALDALPPLYSQAAVTVLPSIDEAFGMVLTESLACGTPVVASGYGGPGEIIASPEIGTTVPLGSVEDLQSAALADQLAEAVVHTVNLARQPETAARCREWASQWSVERIGEEEERLLQSLLEQRSAHLPIRHSAVAAIQ
jgi:glycosyltransferase involved in cell wall biosynthesis